MNGKKYETNCLSFQLTLQAYRQLPHAGSNDFANMFDFFTRVDQRSNLNLNRQLCPNLQSFDEWVAANRDNVIKAMDYPEQEKSDPWCIKDKS